MDVGYVLVDEKRLYESGGLPRGNIFEPLIRALHTSEYDEFYDSIGMTNQMLERSGVNQNFIEHVNSFVLDLKRVGDNGRLVRIIEQRGMQDMTTTITDFERQIMQKCILKGRQEGIWGKAREFGGLMLGDRKSGREVRRYTDLSFAEIQQVKSGIQKSRH